MIDRNVKEPLNLRLVQIHRQHAVGAGRAQHVGDELGRNRHARLVLAILPGVAVVRQHRRDPRRRRPAERVDHDHQLHEVLIDRVAQVGCTMNTSVPRMFSSIWNETSESGNRRSRACPSDTPRNAAISRVSSGMRAARKHLQLAEPGRHERITHRTCSSPPRVGWGGRIRTFEYGIQSPAPYRLATPH